MDHLDKEQQQAAKARNRKTMSTFLLLIAIVVGLAGLVGLGWAWTTYQSIYQGIDISKLSKEPPRSTVFYDRNGEVITELTNSRMEYMPLDQFPKTIQEAVIAVEDARFYEHKGVDFYGIARAFYRNLKSGETVQGGSTITQQLAKTMLFSTEQTYSRKINEAVASIKIEKTYTKDQIMELYLNYIYFGEGSWGLQRAAESYFGKKASELTLAESALLAAIPKSPTNYSPVKKPEQAMERRNLVLNLMAEQGKITAEECDAAKNEEIKLTEKSNEKVAISSSFIDHVMNEAITKYKLTEQEILSSGYQIYTTMAPNVQNAAEEVYRDDSYFPKDNGGLQSGIVLMEPQTGALLGIVGTRSQKQEFRGFNYATQNERQPGSTIKPILVYAPALNQGFGPKDQINDVETDFGGEYKPSNYKKEIHGWITLEEALVQSYNIPAVAMLKEIGIDKGIEFAKAAGLPLQDTDRTLGIALGGMTKGTSPLTMAQAYTVFANNGNLAKAYAITKIVNRQGQLVGKETQPDVQPILDPNVAYTMTKMLEKVVNEGTGQSARMDRPVAGKTGTTQLPDIPEFKDRRGNQIDGSKDAWFVGYTPEIVAAVWLGYEKTNREHYLTSTGGKYPASLFKEVVSRALQDVPASNFPRPEAYAAIVGGKKRINEDKEAMLAASRKRWKDAQAAKAEAEAQLEKEAMQDGAAATAGAKEAGKPGEVKDVQGPATQTANSSLGGGKDAASDKGAAAAAGSGDKGKATQPAPGGTKADGSAATSGAKTGSGTAPAAKDTSGTPSAKSEPAGAAGNKPKTDSAKNEGTAAPATKAGASGQPKAEPAPSAPKNAPAPAASKSTAAPNGGTTAAGTAPVKSPAASGTATP